MNNGNRCWVSQVLKAPFNGLYKTGSSRRHVTQAVYFLFPHPRQGRISHEHAEIPSVGNSGGHEIMITNLGSCFKRLFDNNSAYYCSVWVQAVDL